MIHNPRRTNKFKKQLISIRQKSPELDIPEGSFYNGINNYNLYMKKKDPETKMLKDVMIYDISNGFNNMAVIICKTKPQMATVRPGVFKPAESDKLPEIIYRDAPYVHPRVELLDFSEQPRKVNELETAEIIVTGGAGIGADGFRLLEEFAAALGAKVGATRGAVHTGLASAAQQIGQTGLTVSPKLYIACGVSGSVQHIVGMCGSKKIVAINIDPDAPIFQNCDVGYVGDIFEVIPQLMEKFCI